MQEEKVLDLFYLLLLFFLIQHESDFNKLVVENTNKQTNYLGLISLFIYFVFFIIYTREETSILKERAIRLCYLVETDFNIMWNYTKKKIYK